MKMNVLCHQVIDYCNTLFDSTDDELDVVKSLPDTFHNCSFALDDRRCRHRIVMRNDFITYWFNICYDKESKKKYIVYLTCESLI